MCTVCIWRCKHARFYVEVFLGAVYQFLFIYSLSVLQLLACEYSARF